MARFTTDNARLMTAKALEVRARNRELRRQQAAQPATQAQSQPIAPPIQPPDAYTAERLVRVRKQLSMLDEMLESEKSAQSIDRIAAAIAKLSTLERELAGRPLPGSYRPVQRRERSPGTGAAGPLDVE